MPITRSAKNMAPDFSEATGVLAAGHCVVIPTETVYGLAADATNGEAIARIFEMKQRPSFNPLICHVDGIAMAAAFTEFGQTAKTLAEAFWPGPLTIVLPLKGNTYIHPLVTAGLGTVGVRQPSGFSSDLIRAFGKPLAAPSANRSGRVSPTRADHVMDEFDAEDLLILDDGPCPVGLESTIVKVDQQDMIMLRPGAITADMIEAATGIRPMDGKSTKIEAPGMMKSHYAPSAHLAMDCERPSPDAALLHFGATEIAHGGPSLNLSPSGDLVEAAANLYDHIKKLDASGCETICVSPIPRTGLGIAINDRLARAAAPRDQS